MAKAGLAFNKVSPYMSWPSTILKGFAEVSEIYGAKRSPSGAVTVPPTNVWNLESKPALLYSLLSSY